MALPIFTSLQPNVNISFLSLMQVGSVARFRGYTYLGLVPYSVARTMEGQNPEALVNATRAYFRQGSDAAVDKVLFLVVRSDNSSPITLVPEPLVQAGSVEVSTKVTQIIRVEGEHSKDELSIILSSNGINKFTISTETSS